MRASMYGWITLASLTAAGIGVPARWRAPSHWITESRRSTERRAASSDCTVVSPSLKDFASLSNCPLSAVGSFELVFELKNWVKTASTLPWWEAADASDWLALEI